MASLLVPAFTKNPVPQPSPAMLQCPPAGRNKPEISALPSMIRVIGLLALAPAKAEFIRGPSSVAAPPVCLFLPVLRSQSRAQPISDARIYVIPGEGSGGGAGPRQGIENPESQPAKQQPKAEPTVNRPDFLMKSRLFIQSFDKLILSRSIRESCFAGAD